MKPSAKLVWATKESMKALKKAPNLFISQTILDSKQEDLIAESSSLIVQESFKRMDEMPSAEEMTTNLELIKSSQDSVKTAEDFVQLSIKQHVSEDLKKLAQQKIGTTKSTKKLMGTKKDVIQHLKLHQNIERITHSLNVKSSMPLPNLQKTTTVVQQQHGDSLNNSIVLLKKKTDAGIAQRVVAPPRIDLLDTIMTKQDRLLADKYKSEQEKAAEKQRFELEKRLRNSHLQLGGLGPIEKHTHHLNSGWFYLAFLLGFEKITNRDRLHQVGIG